MLFCDSLRVSWITSLHLTLFSTINIKLIVNILYHLRIYTQPTVSIYAFHLYNVAWSSDISTRQTKIYSLSFDCHLSLPSKRTKHALKNARDSMLQCLVAAEGSSVGFVECTIMTQSDAEAWFHRRSISNQSLPLDNKIISSALSWQQKHVHGMTWVWWRWWAAWPTSGGLIGGRTLGHAAVPSLADMVEPQQH